MKREKLETLIFLALGEASICWSETPKGVFQSEKAKEIGNRLVDELQALTSVNSEPIEQGKYSIELVDDGLYKLFVGRDNEHHVALAWICSLCEFDDNKNATIKTILDALNKPTEVKSESAEEVEKAIQHEAHEYFKRGQLGLEKAADTERAFYKGAKWMHNFANADKKQHAISFIKYIDIYHNNRKDISYDDLYEQYIKDYNEYLTTLNNKEK